MATWLGYRLAGRLARGLVPASVALMSGSTNRTLVIGGSGSGKTTLAEALVAEYEKLRKYRYMVVLTRDDEHQSPFGKYCQASEELSTKVVEAGIDWRAAIQSAGSLFLEVTALDPAPALDAIGRAILELGNVLLVVDEAQQIIDRNTPPGMLEVYTRGRKLGVNIITITQSIKQRAQWGLHATAIGEATTLVTFLKTDPNEQRHVLDIFPELGVRLGQLRTPRDGAPEYAVKDLITGRAILVSREGERDITAGVAAV